MVTQAELMALPRGSGLISRGLDDVSRRTLEFHGYHAERRDAQTYLWRRFLSPGWAMRGEEPAWRVGLERALQAVD